MSSDELPCLCSDRYREQQRFHHINLSFPGVQMVREEPFVFVIHDFVSAAECDMLISMIRSSQQQPSATASAQVERRTSTSMYPKPDEVQWLRERMAAATNVGKDQLEPTKMTQYTRGAFFAKHSDASFLNEKMWAFAAKLADVHDDGVQDPCSWPSRFCTLFIYLNDVESGGCTCFRWLDGSDSMPGAAIFEQSIAGLPTSPPTNPVHPANNLANRQSTGTHQVNAHSPPTKEQTSPTNKEDLVIKPRAGMAVVHFPTTSLEAHCIPDPRTMHESEIADDTKFIVQQFIWPVPLDVDQTGLHEDLRAEWAALQAAAKCK
eukprot:Tamp_22961.p1 GENE.Tamp_22961~~Tamp_22961.p1  ORF type:complete len:320 (+),score=59.05 Tamp_22961:3-962(+)